MLVGIAPMAAVKPGPLMQAAVNLTLVIFAPRVTLAQQAALNHYHVLQGLMQTLVGVQFVHNVLRASFVMVPQLIHLIFLVHLVIIVLRALLTIHNIHVPLVPSTHYHKVHQKQLVFCVLWDHIATYLVYLLYLANALLDHSVLLVQHQRLGGHVPLAITVLMELSWRLIALQECTAQAQETLNHLVTVVLATFASLQLPLLHLLMVLQEGSVQQELTAPRGAHQKLHANQEAMVILKEQVMKLKAVLNALGVIIVKELD